MLHRLRGSCREATEGAFGLPAPYPVAAGSACADAGIPLAAALTAWLHGFAANLVSVAVRAIPIGQSDAVRVLAALEPAILAVAERAACATRDDLGSCAFLSDIAAMRHETLQPRLFIS
jgi:urease accessory protein